MGVRGLTTYINTKQDCFLKYHILHDTSIVIDGHSLGAQLYASSNCFSAFGGDYDKYALHIKKFFTRLKKCKVTCYVIFDGSHERRKLKTAFSRVRSKIHGASRLDAVTQSTIKIFPVLLRDVFKNVLNELQIPHTTCEFEADDEIAAMARHLNCPVLSYDSDFFIYNTLYIPFNTLDTDITAIEGDGERKYGLECKLYKIENMLEHFGGLKKEMLPLLATLLGNDFVKKKMFNKFFTQLKLPKSRHRTNEQQRSIHALLKWLRDETLESAIDKIIGRLKKQHKRKVLHVIKNSINGYEAKYCRSMKYFGLVTEDENLENVKDIKALFDLENMTIEEETIEENDEVSNESDSTEKSSESEECNQVESTVIDLPAIIAESIRNGTMPQPYINLYTHKLYFCSPQAEDYTQEDSFISTLPILQYSFNIINNFSNESFIYVSRENESYKKLIIENLLTNPFENCHTPLENPKMLPLYFDHFIKEHFCSQDLSLLDQLPENYRVFMLSILWWVTKCNVPIYYVYALFICYIMLEVIDEKTGTFRGHTFFHNKHSKTLEQFKKRPNLNVELKELFFNKNKVAYEDCLLVASQLLVCFELSNDIKKRPRSYDRKCVHTFAQFQCCLQQINFLNTLCNKPYMNCKIFNCYNGTFLYNVAQKLEQHIDSLLYIEDNLLKGANTVLLFFKSLCNIFDQCVKQMGIVFAEVERKKGRKKSKKTKESLFLHEAFKSEVYL